MTDGEWLGCSDPTPMLEFLLGKASERKLRLFACACCLRIWHLLEDERSRRAVEAAESFADDLLTVAELRLARAAALEVRSDVRATNAVVGGEFYAASDAAADAAFTVAAELLDEGPLPSDAALGAAGHAANSTAAHSIATAEKAYENANPDGELFAATDAPQVI